MVNIEIDGRRFQAQDGAMVIEAADQAGIPIPRFCYHKKLSVAANCRMCLVDVEKAAKPLPACATPVTEGMKIYTKSAKAINAQKGVMEFLLINHPLDCPICDQGGECDLQDLAVGYGSSHSRYRENKRVVKDKNLGPLIATDMTRCIHCTRCIRFGQEIGGIMELGATGRGEHMQIGTYMERSVDSEMSGNMIDLCPVGALTSKPFRYSARAWEMTTRPSIAPHDCIGSNLNVQVRGNKVMRVLPRENEQVNETWISDRDRFSYEGLNSPDRLRRPMIKKDGQWQDADWDTALEFAVSGLKQATMRHSASQIGALSSPSATIEEMYLLQKFMRALGSANIDHRLRQHDFSDQDIAPLFPWLGQSIEDLENANAVLLIGSNVRKDQPIAGHRLRQASLSGASVMVVNSVDYPFNFRLRDKIIVGPNQMAMSLAKIAKSLVVANNVAIPDELAALWNNIKADETHDRMAKTLKAAGRKVILLGVNALHHSDLSSLRSLAGLIAELTGAHLGYLTDGANSAGGWLAGAIPHRTSGGQAVTKGLHAQEMLQKRLKAYVLLGIEPEFDCDNPNALDSLSKADFVLSLSPYLTETMKRYASVILPIAPFAETSGTFINAEGKWQSFAGVVAPLGETRPAWKILRVMGNLFGIAGFDYVSSEEVRDEVRGLVGDVVPSNRVTWRCPTTLDGKEGGEQGDVAMYSVDAIVRRAPALQATQDAVGEQREIA